MENFQYYNYIFRLASDFQQGIHALYFQIAEAKVESIARFLAAFNKDHSEYYRFCYHFILFLPEIFNLVWIVVDWVCYKEKQKGCVLISFFALLSLLDNYITLENLPNFLDFTYFICVVPETKLLVVTSGFSIYNSMEGEFSVGMYLYLMGIIGKHY